MAKTVSDDEIALRNRARRRLIGAVALVLLAVVILPLVLDGEPRPVREAAEVRIPPKDGPADFGNAAAPVPKPRQADAEAAPAASRPAAMREPAAEKAGPAPSVAAEPPSSAKSEAAGKPVVKLEATPAPAAGAGESGGFVVQLGAFSSAENAKQVRDKVSASGMRSYTETVRTAQGETTRVRAGPFPNREAAEAAREKLAKLGLKGLVTSP